MISLFVFYRSGFRTEEPEALRLVDSSSWPILTWEVVVLQNLPQTHNQPLWLTCSGTTRTTTVKTCHTFTQTGSKSTAAQCLPHNHRPHPSTNSPPKSCSKAAPNLQTLVSGKKSTTGSRTWVHKSLVWLVAPFLNPSAGSLTTLPPAVPTKPLQTSSPRPSNHLGAISPCMEPTVEEEGGAVQ